MLRDYSDLSGFGLNPGFLPADTDKPICGVVVNSYLNYTNSAVAEVGNLIAGSLVSIDTDGKITQKATSASTFSGMVVKSENEIAEHGSLGAVAPGSKVRVAQLGSGLEVYVPCDNTFDSALLNWTVSFDYTTGIASADAPLPGIVSDGNVKIAGKVKIGYKKVINDTTGTVTLVETPCVKIRF